jgi:hypothetical protein
VLAFLDETPYQGEDLLFDQSAPERFLVRCTRDKGLAPGSCLYERSAGNASITLRFPRALIAQWREFLAGSDRLLAQLQGVVDPERGRAGSILKVLPETVRPNGLGVDTLR